jgi:hypothetical protein
MTYGIYSLATVSILGGFISLLLPKITTGYKYKEMAKPAAG